MIRTWKQGTTRSRGRARLFREAVGLLVVLAASAALTGCRARVTEEPSETSEHSPTTDEDASVDEIAECADYFRAYDACMKELLPGHPAVGAARVTTARSAMQRLDVPAARRACADAARQLRDSCH